MPFWCFGTNQDRTTLTVWGGQGWRWYTASIEIERRLSISITASSSPMSSFCLIQFLCHIQYVGFKFQYLLALQQGVVYQLNRICYPFNIFFYKETCCNVFKFSTRSKFEQNKCLQYNSPNIYSKIKNHVHLLRLKILD